MKKMISVLTTLSTLHLYAATSVEVGMMSNYLAHGVTQTEDKPSAYIKIDWNNDTGLFLGSKVTGVHFMGDDVGYGAQMDFYSGYSLVYGDFTYTTTLSYTHYAPQDYSDFVATLPFAHLNNQNLESMYIEGFDFANIGVNVGWRMFEVGISYTFYGLFPDDYAYSQGDLFYHINAKYEFDYDISATFSIGHYDFDTPTPAQNYTYFEAKAYKSLGEYGDIGLAIDVVRGNNRDSTPIFVLLYKKAFNL